MKIPIGKTTNILRDIFFLLIAAGSLFSCRQDNESPGHGCGGAWGSSDVNVRDTLHVYYFENGSYWNYEDTVAMITDSMYVASVTTNDNFVTCVGAVEQHQITLIDLPALDHYYLSFWYEYMFFGEHPTTAMDQYLSIFDSGSVHDGQQDIYLGSVDILGNTFEGVHKIGPRIYTIGDSTTVEEDFYFAPAIGIIRWEKFLNGEKISDRLLSTYHIEM